MARTDWAQSFREYHTYEERCNRVWCRIHWTSVWYPGGPEHERFPLDFNVLSSESGWSEVTVFCGPGAYLPKRPK